MRKLKLNKNFGKKVPAHNYELEPKEQYVISFKDEIEQQQAIYASIYTMGLPAMNDYHNWLKENNFDVNMPNPTNSFVEPYYGVRSLWTTDLSQGMVVKAKDDDDYYIVMECSRENEGFKYTQIIVTLGGCI